MEKEESGAIKSLFLWVCPTRRQRPFTLLTELQARYGSWKP